MKIYRLFYILYQIKLLSPVALLRLSSAIFSYGINLMTLLHFSARMHRDKIAVADERETLTYAQLSSQSKQLEAALKERYQLSRGKKVGVLCRNHASLVKTIYAVSLTGAALYLLNPEMSSIQLNGILKSHEFDLLVYDEEQHLLVEDSSYSNAKLFSYHDTLPAINSMAVVALVPSHKRRRAAAGTLVLLTGGTTGKPKEAVHQPSLFNYLDPFYAFLHRLKLLNYRTAYIATPIYHGYGIAVLLLFCALGKKVIIQRRFEAERACEWVRVHQAEVITVVPLMLHKMLTTNAADMRSLACIASGGAELHPTLVKETLSQLGDVLFNLYGTSEAGLNIIATPQDLTYSPHTIGRIIKGARIKITDEHQLEVETGKVGQLCIQNQWSMKNGASTWIKTGDMGYQDQNGYYFLCGRVDSMIVSAGENVYPFEVEQILLTHPQIEDAAVIGIADEHFGQRLKAIVQLYSDETLREEELLEWLRGRVARYQMPKEIVFVDHLPYTSLGKLNRKIYSS